MRYRLQRHDGTDCSATMVPITVLRMVPIQRYRHDILENSLSNKNLLPFLSFTFLFIIILFLMVIYIFHI